MKKLQLTTKRSKGTQGFLLVSVRHLVMSNNEYLKHLIKDNGSLDQTVANRIGAKTVLLATCRLPLHLFSWASKGIYLWACKWVAGGCRTLPTES